MTVVVKINIQACELGSNALSNDSEVWDSMWIQYDAKNVTLSSY